MQTIGGLAVGEHSEIWRRIGSLFSHKIAYNSARIQDTIQPPFLHQTGGFRERPIYWCHSNCFRADPCYHGNKIWAIFAQNGHKAHRAVIFSIAQLSCSCTNETANWYSTME